MPTLSVPCLFRNSDHLSTPGPQNPGGDPVTSFSAEDAGHTVVTQLEREGTRMPAVYLSTHDRLLSFPSQPAPEKVFSLPFTTCQLQVN